MRTPSSAALPQLTRPVTCSTYGLVGVAAGVIPLSAVALLLAMMRSRYR